MYYKVFFCSQNGTFRGYCYVVKIGTFRGSYFSMHKKRLMKANLAFRKHKVLFPFLINNSDVNEFPNFFNS